MSGKNRVIIIACLVLVMMVITMPITVSGYVGLGGYLSEKLLGSGSNASLMLGSGADLIVLGRDGEVPAAPASTTDTLDALWNALTVVIAAGILILVLRFTGNPVAALIATLLGIIALTFIRHTLL